MTILVEKTMDSCISPATSNSANYLHARDSLSSRTSGCSSYYSSFSDDEWEDVSGGSGSGSNGEEIIMESYQRRLSEESRKRLIRKLDSVRHNPNHHMRRIVPVGDRSSIDGGVPSYAQEVPVVLNRVVHEGGCWV